MINQFATINVYAKRKEDSMFYIVNSLITEEGRQTFSLLGITEDKQQAAALAAEVYKDYNKNASFQNIEMITEWLATRRKYSFRKDKEHRLQLAITEAGELNQLLPAEAGLVFSAAAEEEELARRMSQALFEGQHTASRGEFPPKAAGCPLES